MNCNKLKGKLVECGVTYEKAAIAIGVKTGTFSNKINGKARFYIEELEKLGDLLGLTRDERADLFLS